MENSFNLGAESHQYRQNSSGGSTKRKRNHRKTLRDEGIQATSSDAGQMDTFANDSSQF